MEVPMMDFEFIPATEKTVYLDKYMFATIMYMIPTGRLTTQAVIYEMWAKRKKVGCYEIESSGILPIDKRML